MGKLKVQAQHLQPGDVVGSGEMVGGIVSGSVRFASNKVQVYLDRRDKLTDVLKCRSVLWGKYTMINVKRMEKVNV